MSFDDLEDKQQSLEGDSVEVKTKKEETHCLAESVLHRGKDITKIEAG